MQFTYMVVRSSKRKTISLQIKNSEVTVRVPTLVTQHYIDKLIAEKTPWIMKKLADSRQYKSSPPPSYLPGKYILIFGTPKLIDSYFGKKADVLLPASRIDVVIPLRLEEKMEESTALEKQIKKQISTWMKEQANSYLAKRLPELSKQLSLYPAAYKVRLYKSRWGSCNSRKELSFNYLLTMAPSWVFDYVIVHELCHIKHLNHSSSFWSLVETHLPNYKQASLWLKENQHKLA
jgi:predicted metal-dependent hydrolase